MITLRTMVHLAVGITASVAPLPAAFAAVPQRDAAPTVMIDSGTIEGKMTETGVEAFLGIPYAAPPVRNLRWRAPQPVAPWNTVYHADRFGPQCPQPQRNTQANHYSGAEVTSEDCLYVNVWAKPGANQWGGGAWFLLGETRPEGRAGHRLYSRRCLFHRLGQCTALQR